jgi:hypothetical protein
MVCVSMSSFRIVRAVFFSSLVAIAAMAQDDAPPVRVDATYSSRSVFRGVARAADSLHAGVELSRENLHGGVGTRQPFAGSVAREVDLHAGYRWSLTDGVTVEALLTHTWFDRVPGGGVENSLEAGLAATLAPLNGFTPSLRYYHDFSFRADTIEVAVARSTALPKLGAFLEWNFYGGWTSGRDWRPESAGPRRRDAYGYWGGEVSLPYRIGSNSIVAVGAHYAEAFGRSSANGPFGQSGSPGLWVTLGVSHDF